MLDIANRKAEDAISSHTSDFLLRLGDSLAQRGEMNQVQ